MVNFLHISDIHLPDKQGDLWNGIDPCKKLEQMIDKRPVEAIEYFLKAKAQHGRILTGKGDWTLLVKHLEKAIEMNPTYAEPYRMLANVYMRRLGDKLSVQEAALAAHSAIEKAIELLNTKEVHTNQYLEDQDLKSLSEMDNE